MKQGLKIVNMKQVQDDFNKFSSRKQTELIKELEMSALEIETTAKRKLKSDGHVVTASLWTSLHVVRKNDNFVYTDKLGKSHNGSIPMHFDENERYIGTNVAYANRVEMLPDGGYLAYAANMQRQKFLNNIKKIISNVK